MLAKEKSIDVDASSRCSNTTSMKLSTKTPPTEIDKTAAVLSGTVLSSQIDNDNPLSAPFPY
ncbi:hypothetical protein ABB37_04902 [Leptomonas pyrrhocoris]|uniref:Uncharacterized protein n=1 Tax=Leptomonas pyrrhocoris TaxID=157538 RepID=A0A0M9G0F0_LEPPY|nr:hypothetical protein ABB37_04902 [Leptomonas pyrrhocoris]KPA79805.1 hypothetical protein ABB37_04902 [Leptomonas pyrrhocoris]|eukprot:XP_015658244.1 hypothetical protein ABB37_04902 [Leptomonas pyrrhocoris]